MEDDRYRRITAHLVAEARRQPDIVGLVALGSLADRSHRPDEWSDHDVWVVARDCRTATRLRDDRSWLPQPHRVVAHYVETRHGRSVIYDDGHLLELAVFDESELELTRANDYRVLYDGGDIEDRLAAIAARTTREMEVAGEAGHAAGRFVTQLIIGLGRCGRGELLSANAMIRGHALSSLLRALTAHDPGDDRLDNLDPHRRFELARPELADRLHRVLRLPEVEVARSLLAIAGENLELSPPVVAAVQRAIDRAARAGHPIR